MIIVALKGGLGNQMFQYSLYKKLCFLKKNVFLDDQILRKYGNQHNGLDLLNAFPLQFRQASINHIEALSNCRIKFSTRVKGKFFSKKKDSHYFEKEDMFNNNIFDLDNCYLDGYWQDLKYFEDIESVLKTDFCFKPPTDSRNLKMLKKLENSNSISIHIRRGDYLSKENRLLFGGSCSLDYYKQSIKLIKNKIENPFFCIFTDDSEWCRKIFQDFYVVDWNCGRNSYLDMFLMSKCKHNIIANSSFSWWSGWLNQNMNKMVVSPSKWNNKIKFPNLYPKEWIKME